MEQENKDRLDGALGESSNVRLYVYPVLYVGIDGKPGKGKSVRLKGQGKSFNIKTPWKLERTPKQVERILDDIRKVLDKHS
jgi:hypothetical protein